MCSITDQAIYEGNPDKGDSFFLQIDANAAPVVLYLKSGGGFSFNVAGLKILSFLFLFKFHFIHFLIIGDMVKILI